MNNQAKSILVTGASSGIGLAITTELVTRQYQVFACARKEEDLKRLQNEVGAIPVEMVVNAVMDGLESPKPRTRYYVGKGVSFAAKLFSLLPDRWLDWIISKHI